MGVGLDSAITVRPGGSKGSLSSQSVAVGRSDHRGVRSVVGEGGGGVRMVSVSRVSQRSSSSVRSMSVTSMSISSVASVGEGSSQGLGVHWGVRGVRDGGGSIGDSGSSIGLVGIHRGSMSGISNGGGVGDWNVLLGGDGLHNRGLLVGLVDGLSGDDVLLDALGQHRSDDLLAVNHGAALVRHSGGDVVHLLSDLVDVGLFNDGNTRLNLSVGTAGDHMLLDVGHGVAGIAGGQHGCVRIPVGDS